jgi:NRPS condensation-like uncharacterized protein
LLNKKWRQKEFKFTEREYDQLYEVYWEHEAGTNLFIWCMDEHFTNALMSRCRQEQVTVHTALCTAFLGASRMIQGHKLSYLKKFRMPVEVRNMFDPPISEALGLFASSLDLMFEFDLNRSFWDNAKRLHRIIRDKNKIENLAKFVIFDQLEPSLMDALYFQKYGFINDKLVDLLMKKTNFSNMSLGLIVTNLGRFKYPQEYGAFYIEEIYGPCVYGPVVEKALGVCTIGGKMSFSFGHNKNRVSIETMERIKELAMGLLTKNSLY